MMFNTCTLTPLTFKCGIQMSMPLSDPHARDFMSQELGYLTSDFFFYQTVHVDKDFAEGKQQMLSQTKFNGDSGLCIPFSEYQPFLLDIAKSIDSVQSKLTHNNDKLYIYPCKFKDTALYAECTYHCPRKGRFKEARAMRVVPRKGGVYKNGYDEEALQWYWSQAPAVCFKSFMTGDTYSDECKIQDINTSALTQALYETFAIANNLCYSPFYADIKKLNVIVPDIMSLSLHRKGKQNHLPACTLNGLCEPFLRNIQKVNNNSGGEATVQSGE